jgi:hypothetical protein
MNEKQIKGVAHRTFLMFCNITQNTSWLDLAWSSGDGNVKKKTAVLFGIKKNKTKSFFLWGKEQNNTI